MDIGTLVKELGLPVGLVLFFVWQSYMERRALGARLSAVEDYQRDRLEGLVVASTEAIKGLCSRPCVGKPRGPAEDAAKPQS